MDRSLAPGRAFRRPVLSGAIGVLWAVLAWVPSACAAPPRPTPPQPVALHPSLSGERVCLSLRRLLEEAQKSPVAPAALHLGGIGWLEGYVVDRDAGDLILVGRRAAGWPSLHLDDLVVNLRSIWSGGAPPYCSLDPTPQSVLRTDELFRQGVPRQAERMPAFVAQLRDATGPQQTVIGGVPRNSHHARVMIEADYRMKKLSQGLESLPGLSSCLDLTIAEARKSIDATGRLPAGGASMSRFWFHLAQGEPTYLEGEGSVLLARCNVVILTEAQRSTSDGKLVDSGGEDANAQAFAAQLSGQFETASTYFPDFAELANLFRLSAVLRTLHLQRATSQARLDLGYLLRSYACTTEAPLEAALPGLVNSKSVRWKKDRMVYTISPLVCGGVSMEMRPALEKAEAAKVAGVPGNSASASASPLVQELTRSVRQARPDARALTWVAPVR